LTYPMEPTGLESPQAVRPATTATAIAARLKRRKPTDGD